MSDSNPSWPQFAAFARPPSDPAAKTQLSASTCAEGRRCEFRGLCDDLAGSGAVAWAGLCHRGANPTITVTFMVAPPAGSTVSCSLSLISGDQRGPSDTQSTSAPVSCPASTCQIAMYFG
jgi:hypothetical protein